jgi:O-methyltransferase
MNDRQVWVAHCLEGLPEPSLPQAAGYDFSAHKEPILGSSPEDVQENFRRYDLLDDRVRSLGGWFCDTLPSAPIDTLVFMT